MLLKTTLFIIISLVAYTLSDYYSDRRTSQRELIAMFESANTNLTIIENYLKHHNQETDSDYDKALHLAAELDTKYLNEIVDYYSIGNLILNTSAAHLILQQLPSESINLNYTAGRIYSSSEFSRYDPLKAVEHLKYAALRGSANAAASLSEIYTKSNCYIEAITWAKQANKRALTTVCSQLPVNVDLLNEEQWSAVIYNEDELITAERDKRLPELRYSENCNIIH